MTQTLASLRNAMPDLVALRHDLHRHPELGLEEHRTSALVAARLEALGYSVARGLAGTGLVGSLTVGAAKRAVAIRADMDALPILEETGAPHASLSPGRMHACGHDGHTAMLLGAAEAIAARRNFEGTVHLVFQPAEETVGGARIMVEEGLFERFPADAVFALHNDPGRPLGRFALRAGPIMAAVDEARIVVRGHGGHGAEPAAARDPIVAGAAIVLALQTIVARNVHPVEPAVVTVGAFHSGTVSNVIPETAEIVVGLRSFDAETRDLLERRVREVAELQARSLGCEAEVTYERSYDATINHAAETDYLRGLARRFAGEDNVEEMRRPSMGSEDFGYMLKERPGCYFFLGAGGREGGDFPLHHPRYDFNDDLLAIGAAFWTELVEDFLAPGRAE